VENVFHLQLIGEGNDIQLNLKWTTLEEKRNEEYFCEKCSTKDLYYKLEGLVEKLVGEKKVEVVVQKKPIVVVEEKVKGVLYRRLVNGKWGWYKSGNEKKDGKYVGEIENGVPNGQGTLTKPNGVMYEGEFRDGYRNGQGTYTWSDGDMYEGEFKDGKRNGQGTLTFSNGNKYLGKFKNGIFNGQGTFTFLDV